MGDRDLVRASIHNHVARNDASLRALGLTPVDDGGLWYCLEPGGEIYVSAIVVERDVDAAAVPLLCTRLIEARPDGASIVDSWERHDLARLGFAARAEEWWGRGAVASGELCCPSDLVIREAKTTAEVESFEVAETEGFSGGRRPPGPPRRYGEALLSDDRFRLFVGYAGGEPVTTSQAVVAGGVVGIYGVSTVPRARGRGYGEAMTWRAASCESGLPVVLQPSDEGRALYRRMGFRRVGAFTVWRWRGLAASRPRSDRHAAVDFPRGESA